MDAQQPVGRDATAVYAGALRELYEAAGRPVYEVIIKQAGAQRPPLHIADSSLSDWLTGKNVPSDAKVSLFLVKLLSQRARRRVPQFQPQPEGWWEEIRARAVEERRALRRSGRPAGHRSGRTGIGRPLQEVQDPFSLEVHRPIQVQDTTGLAVLPSYVARDHDVTLDQVVASVLEGRSGVAVLVGGSSTGKTRACWEALTALRQAGGWRLWHPLDPTRPRATLAALSQVGPKTVVWLNETQHYLLPDEIGEHVAAGLRELLRDPHRRPVLVLGTLWPHHHFTLTTRPENEPDPHAQARELLAGHTIPVPEAFTGTDLQTLRDHAGQDIRLAHAVTKASDGHIAQYLAGVPVLMERYQTANPVARALIHTAMDARRLGHGPYLPVSLLSAAAPGYLTDTEWDALDDNWLDSTLAYCRQRCNGIPGPLTRHRPNLGHDLLLRLPTIDAASAPAEPTYKLADYLEEHGRRTRAELIPPRGFWVAAAAVNDRDALSALAQAAQDRGLLRLAAHLHTNATSHGHSHSAAQLVHLMHQVQPTDKRPARFAVAQILAHLRDQPITEQDAVRVGPLLEQLVDICLHDQARHLATQAAAHMPLSSTVALADLLRTAHFKAMFEQVCQQLALRPLADQVPIDDLDTLIGLLPWLWSAGLRDQLAQIAARIAAQTPIVNLRTINPLLVWFITYIETKELRDPAMLMLKRAVDHVRLSQHDRPSEVGLLVRWLMVAGMTAEAAELLDRAAHTARLDDPPGMNDLLAHMRRIGMREQTKKFLERAAAHPPLHHDRWGVAGLLVQLRAEGMRQQMITVVRAASSALIRDPGAVRSMLDELQQADLPEQVTELLDRNPAVHVTVDNLIVVGELARSLRAVGAHEQATTLLVRAVKTASPYPLHGVACLLGGLRETGLPDLAVALLQWTLDRGHVYDLRGVAFLSDAGHHQTAMEILDRALAHTPIADDDHLSELLRELHDAGAHEQAAALLSRAVTTGALQPGNEELVRQLRETGHQEQARNLVERLPAAGYFEQLLEHDNNRGRFPFGRDDDGRPAGPWRWDDLTSALSTHVSEQ